MNLLMFPFDVQRLSLQFESDAHPADEVTMAPFPGGKPVHMIKEMRENGLPEWDIQGCYETTLTNVLEFDDSEYSRFQVDVVVARRPEHGDNHVLVNASSGPGRSHMVLPRVLPQGLLAQGATWPGLRGTPGSLLPLRHILA